MLRLRFLLLTLLLLVSTAIGQYEQHAGWYRSSWVHGINAMIPKQGLALLVNPGAQMIEQAQGNKKYPALVTGDEVVQNATFYNFTFDYPSIGEASPFYESDFSSGTDYWEVKYGTIIGNVDGIDGEDDCLKFYADNSSGLHYIRRYLLNNANSQHFKVTAKVYIPSANTTLKQVIVSDGSTVDGSQTVTSLDSWTNINFEIVSDMNHDYLIFMGADNTGNTSFTGAGVDTDDIFYVKDVQVQRVGLVAHWVFDDYYHAQEGTGKTALQDLTGNGHDLTASAGFDWENQFDGDNPAYKDGNAERFDGVDDEFHIAGDDFTPYSNDFSVAFWFNTSVGDGQYHMIAETYDGVTTNWQLIVEPTYNKLRAVFSGDVASQSLFSLSPVNDGNWHLGIMVRSGTNLYLFVDGVQVASASIDIGSIKDINNLNIGSRGGSSYFFNGYLSEGAYFNRALSATEVKALYAKAYGWDWDEVGDLQNDNFKQVISGGGTLTQDVTTLDNTLYKEQLVGEGVNNIDYFGETTSHTVTLTDGTWTSASVKEVTNVDEHSSTITDYSGNGNHGLAQGGLETGQPVHPYSWEFDGVDDYVDFGDVLDINSNDVLIPIWFKTSSTASYLPLIGKMANAVNNGFMFYLSSGQPRIDIGDGTNNYSYNFGGSDLRDNQWHYVVLLLKSGVWEVWIDNILLSTWANPVSSFNSTDNLWIGRFWAGYYEGKLGIISPYLFDGQDGRPATILQNYVNAYIKKIYNNTRRYYVAN